MPISGRSDKWTPPPHTNKKKQLQRVTITEFTEHHSLVGSSPALCCRVPGSNLSSHT
jgi:hypothetical protein